VVVLALLAASGLLRARRALAHPAAGEPSEVSEVLAA
jgi:hypothetical protein